MTFAAVSNSTLTTYDVDLSLTTGLALNVPLSSTTDEHESAFITPTQRNSQSVVVIKNTTGALQWVVSPGAAWSAQGKTAATSTSSSISTTTLTVAGTITGTFQVGQYIIGAGVTDQTRITALGTGTGGAGTYTVSISQTVTSKPISAGSLSGTTAAAVIDVVTLDTSKYLSATGVITIRFAPLATSNLVAHGLTLGFLQLP